MASIRIHRRRLFLLTVLICGGFIIYLELVYKVQEDPTDTVILSPSHLACQQPKLPINTSNGSNFFHQYDPIVCAKEGDWVTVEGSRAVVSKRAIKVHGQIECQYSELVRIDDDRTTLGVSSFSKGDFTFTTSDFYKASCKAADGKRWTSVLAGMRTDAALRDEHSWSLVPDGAVKLNVLMLALGSLSRAAFIRTLPKSYRQPQCKQIL